MKNKGSLWAGLLALLLAAPAAALIQPQVINFQGKLLDPTTNLPKTGLVGLTFNLYRSLTGGTALWTETQSNVALTNGVFAVELGTYTALPPDLFLGASAYLGVTVVGDAGGEMAPRSRLAMSPYAFTASQLSDAGAVNLIADNTYSTFTNAGNLLLPAGVSASSAAFTNGVNATSGTFTQFVTASSAIFTASGSGAFGLTVSSGVQIQNGVLDMNGAQGISNSYGLQTGTLTVTGPSLTVGGSSFTVTGGSATLAYGLTASSATFGAVGGPFAYGVSVASGITMQKGTFDLNGGLDVSGMAVVSGTMTAGQFVGIGASSTAIKLSGQSVASSVVLAADAELGLPIGANQTYIIDGLVEAQSASAAPGFKMTFALGGATQVHIDAFGLWNSSSTAHSVSISSSGAVVVFGTPANVVNPIMVKGFVTNGAAAGSLQLQWAQNVSNATPVVVSSGSYINATRVK